MDAVVACWRANDVSGAIRALDAVVAACDPAAGDARAWHLVNRAECLLQLDRHLLKKVLVLLEVKAAEGSATARFGVGEERLVIGPALVNPLPELHLPLHRQLVHQQFTEEHPPGLQLLGNLLSILLLPRPWLKGNDTFIAIPAEEFLTDRLR